MSGNNSTNHQKAKNTLRVVGFVCLLAGIACTVTGLVDFFRAAASFGEMPRLFFLTFIGFPLIAIGSSALALGYKREIMQYNKNESVPVINEIGTEIAPAVKSIASAVREGLSAEDTSDASVCSCGTVNEAGSKFCKECGRPLSRICPQCGKAVDIDSKFCNLCGKEL